MYFTGPNIYASKENVVYHDKGVRSVSNPWNESDHQNSINSNELENLNVTQTHIHLINRINPINTFDSMNSEFQVEVIDRRHSKEIINI